MEIPCLKKRKKKKKEKRKEEEQDRLPEVEKYGKDIYIIRDSVRTYSPGVE